MNGQDLSATPLIFGSLLPAAILIIVSFILGRISKRRFRHAINSDGVNQKGVVRWSVISGLVIFVLTLFPLPNDIAIMVIALVFSLATAAITFYARNMVATALLSVAIIGGIISAGTALNALATDSLNQFQQLGLVLSTWPILAGPAFVAAAISAALSASAKPPSY